MDYPAVFKRPRSRLRPVVAVSLPGKKQLSGFAAIAAALITQWLGLESRIDQLEQRLDASITQQASITQAYLVGLQSQIAPRP